MGISIGRSWTFVAALALLSGCGSGNGSSGSGGDGNEAADAAAAAALLSNLVQPEDPASLEARAKAAMAVILRKPREALYANVRSGAGGAVCGEIDARNGKGGFGGFHPFVVLPDGSALISEAARISFGNPDDPFPDLYIQYCATPAELQLLGPRVRDVDPAAPANQVTAAIPDLPDEPPASPSAGTPPAPPAPGAPARPTTGDDSFFNSVAHKK